MQSGLGRHIVRPRYRRVAAPANLETAEQIGLGARHPVQHRRPKSQVGENLGIGVKVNGGAAAVVYGSARQQLCSWDTAPITLGPQLPVARDFDLELVGQRV